MTALRFFIIALGLALLGGIDIAGAQQEKLLRRTTPVPDSLKNLLPTKVDESKIRRNWGKLKRGMRPKDVETLLGKPIRIASGYHDNSFTWYYGNRSVIFDITKDCVRYWDVQK